MADQGDDSTTDYSMEVFYKSPLDSEVPSECYSFSADFQFHSLSLIVYLSLSFLLSLSISFFLSIFLSIYLSIYLPPQSPAPSHAYTRVYMHAQSRDQAFPSIRLTNDR